MSLRNQSCERSEAGGEAIFPDHFLSIQTLSGSEIVKTVSLFYILLFYMLDVRFTNCE